MSYKRYSTPLIDQLRIDSRELRELYDHTIEATENGRNQHLNAVRVLIAQHEKVVVNTPFAHDPLPITIAGKSHTDLCKPSYAFPEPMEHVLSCL